MHEDSLNSSLSSLLQQLTVMHTSDHWRLSVTPYDYLKYDRQCHVHIARKDPHSELVLMWSAVTLDQDAVIDLVMYP